MPSHAGPDQPHAASDADGAWGLRFPTLDGHSLPLVECPAAWPPVTVDVRVQPNAEPQIEWGPQRARHPLLGGHQIEIRREPLAVDLILARPTPPECVIAPHLTSAASTIALWMGRPAIHGGAFLYEGGAWVLLGDKGQGKSTTLGYLATAGVPIMTDDLVVCDGDDVLAGPRCVDLRDEPAKRLNAGRELGVIGTRERWRVDIPACPPSAPLRGWIFLHWGPEIAVERLSPAERMARLAQERAIAVPWEDPAALLDLAAQPSFAWYRPKEWRSLKPAIARLLAQIADE
ncbi:MAG: hypothetical protein ACXVRN_14485 [Solirubrobacteraceae bacterium]